jgi:hypothetical protein
MVILQGFTKGIVKIDYSTFIQCFHDCDIGMKKISISVLLFLVCVYAVSAASSDSISTVYKNGEFVTQYTIKIKYLPKVTAEVADYLVTDFHTKPGNLFNWALKDLGLQNKSNELIIVFRDSNHDIKTGITHGKFDVVVPNFTTFSNIKVDAIVAKTNYSNGVTKVKANIVYSSLLLKNALGTLSIVPQQNNEQLLITNVTIQFGWFFNLFITQKRYKSIVEWRIKKFAENIKAECERRQSEIVSKK